MSRHRTTGVIEVAYKAGESQGARWRRCHAGLGGWTLPAAVAEMGRQGFAAEASHRWQAVDFEQLKPKRVDLCEHAVQRGVVGEWPC